MHMVFFLCCLSWLATGPLGAQPTISTFAGKPPAEGKAVGLNVPTSPNGLAEDSSGNIYLGAGNIIYKITPAGDAIRYAGTGWGNGETADGSLARDTRLFLPSDPKFGPDGNLYFIEKGNGNKIRIVETATTIIRTVYTPSLDGGGFTLPYYAINIDGSLIVTQSSLAGLIGVFRVNPNSKDLERLAAPNRIVSLAVEPVTGDLYVLADSYLTELLQINRATGAVKKIARPEGDFFISKIRALGDGNLLFIGAQVDRFSVSTGKATRVAGVADAYVIAEGSSAIDTGSDFSDALPRAGASEWFVTQSGARPLWKIDSSQRYRLLLGDSNDTPILGNLPLDTRIYSPSNLIALPEGGGVVDIENRAQFLELKEGRPTTQIYGGNLVYRAWAMDTQGNLYLYTTSNIFRVDRGSSQARVYAPSPRVTSGGSGPRTIAISGDGDVLFVSNLQPILRWNGAAWVEFAPAAQDFQYQSGPLRVGAEGDLFYSTLGGITHFRVAAQTFETITPAVDSDQLSPKLNYYNFEVDSDSNIYLTADTDRLVRIDAGTRYVTTIAGGQAVVESGAAAGAKAESALFITADRKNGDVYFYEPGLERIRKVSGANAYYPNPAISFRSGSKLAVAPTGSTATITIGARTPTTAWQAVSDRSWIIFGSTSSGTGTGVMTLILLPNPDSTPRSGTVRIGDQVFTITQEGAVSVGLLFFPVSPCRVADTRNAPIGPFGQPALESKSSRDFPIAVGSCGIPATARAYAVNVTVVPKGPLGYVTIWPAGQAQPVVSTLNALDGRVKANAAIVPAGVNSAVSVYATDATEVILDISGYFAAGTNPQGAYYYPQAPCRALDTRTELPRLVQSGSRNIKLGCSLPLDATAFPVNFTAIPDKTIGYLALYDRQLQPTVSVLNAVTGAVTANAAIVGTRDFRVFSTDPGDLVVDVNGNFGPAGKPGAMRFFPVLPCRVLDTRNVGDSMIAPRTSRDIAVPSSGCGIPSTAAAYSVNATVIPRGIFGYLTLWATGQAMPVVSTLNAMNGAITSNAAIVQAGANGGISAFHSDAAHLLIDINGYFAP